MSQQAALCLKRVVNQNWPLSPVDQQKALADSQKPFNIQNKENVGAQNGQVRQDDATISEADRAMLKQDIFSALDNVVGQTDPKGKVLISSLENIIQNIAELDYPTWSQYAQQQIHDRLTQGDERFKVSALRALKSLFQAFEFEIK